MMRRLAGPLLIGLLGCALLVALGVWQVRRLAWKEELLAGIEARIAGPPVALPPPGAVAADPDAWRYTPVRIAGATTGEDVLVISGMKGVGPGYEVIAAFETADGRRILVDRGFLHEDLRARARPPVALDLAGNIHWPRETDGYTPEPDIAGRLWFARDVPSIAAFLKTEPLLVVAAEPGGDSQGIEPVPLGTAGIPNDHLQYAVTWFSLALVWAGMTVWWMWRIRRQGS
ncbi:MAG: SURF1 family protein [Rhodobacteraceae bacterium]|nr:SURF1 family protein [Paracoccaceae bacterium]